MRHSLLQPEQQNKEGQGPAEEALLLLLQDCICGLHLALNVCIKGHRVHHLQRLPELWGRQPAQFTAARSFSGDKRFQVLPQCIPQASHLQAT